MDDAWFGGAANMPPARERPGELPASEGYAPFEGDAFEASLAASDSELARLLEHGRRLAHLADAPAVQRQVLQFTCGAIRCAVPLAELRGWPSLLPPIVPLPFSPPWLLGVFPLRDASEILGLADPLPMLTGDADASGGPWIAQEPASQQGARRFPFSSVFAPAPQHHFTHREMPAGAPRPLCMLIVGSGERSLALAVNAIHDLAAPQEHEMLAIHDISADAPMPFQRRYLSAIYTPAGAKSCVVLHISRLLDDLLAALEVAEGEAAAHSLGNLEVSEKQLPWSLAVGRDRQAHQREAHQREAHQEASHE